MQQPKLTVIDKIKDEEQKWHTYYTQRKQELLQKSIDISIYYPRSCHTETQVTDMQPLAVGGITRLASKDTK